MHTNSISDQSHVIPCEEKAEVAGGGRRWHRGQQGTRDALQPAVWLGAEGRPGDASCKGHSGVRNKLGAGSHP